MNVRAQRRQTLICAMAASVLLLLVTESPRLQDLIAPEPPPVAKVKPEGRYLPMPGNRFDCPEKLADGRVYVGYIAHQADGSAQPIKPYCVYMTPQAGLV